VIFGIGLEMGEKGSNDTCESLESMEKLGLKRGKETSVTSPSSYKRVSQLEHYLNSQKLMKLLFSLSN